MVKFGFRFRSRLEFHGTMPAQDRVDEELVELHNRDVKGRFGFWLVVFGVLVLSLANYCPWAAYH
jgi:hypothetical protein